MSSAPPIGTATLLVRVVLEPVDVGEYAANAQLLNVVRRSIALDLVARC